jgi:cyclophilin family peptidyl-prolyl cis-trans isomerase
VFGKVTSGLEIVKKIGLMPTGSMRGFSDVPVKPVIIRNVKVIKDELK